MSSTQGTVVCLEHSNSVIPSMAPLCKRIPLILFLLLFLILSLSFIPFFALHPTSIISFPIVVDRHGYDTHTTHLKFSLIIKVFTFNRLSSLTRCLNSLSKAHYDNYTSVHLHVYIDHIPIPALQDPKGSSIFDERLNLSKTILNFVDGFKWDYGDKLVHYRTSNAGLQAQWLEAWWPASDHEFAFVVEDDMEVSPFYFGFIKDLILNFYYNESNYSPMIFGASLQRPTLVPGNHGNKMKLDSESPLLLYHLVGTWGQLLFPRPWKEFRLWYDIHKSKGIKPFLRGMVSMVWYRNLGEKIWTPWHIKFVHSRGYFNLDTNFKNKRALSVSHRDAGINYMKSAGPDSWLVDENSNYDIPSPKLHLSSFKWFDFCFRQVIPNRIARNPIELERILHAIHKFNTVIVINLQHAFESKVRNLLCHCERLAIKNYVFVGPRSTLLFELSRRGHSVIDVDELSASTDFYTSSNIHDPNAEIMKDILAISYVIKKSIEFKYNTWLVDSNTLLLSGNLNVGLPYPAYDFYIGETSKLILTRSSSFTSILWNDDFVNKVLAVAASLTSNGSFSSVGLFVDSLKTLLERKGMKYDRINESEYGLNLDSVDSELNSPGNEKKFVFWSSRGDTETILQKKLKQMGMWVLDGDSSCTSVYCTR